MGFVLEDKLIDPFMTDRNSAACLKPKTDLFGALVEGKQMFNGDPGVIVDTGSIFQYTAFFS